MKKPVYFISGANHNDEKFPIVTIYKLCRIGKSDPSYIFIAVNIDGGIGTATDNHAKSEREAIINVIKYGDQSFKLIEGDFSEALIVKDEIYNNLLEIKSKSL